MSGAARYDDVALDSAARVIERYSTSFARACRLLDEPVRSRVRAVYALVRVADEVVDDTTLPLTTAQRADALAALHAETARALVDGWSANLVVHAFAVTARRCGIGADLVDPFFVAMRTDLERDTHDAASLGRYVYGSAEVVGLMCLRTFLADLPADARDARYAELADGARRLGAAFQKVNFLRDLGADQDDRGRTYLPGVRPGALTDAERDAFLDEVDDDLRAAQDAIAALPASCRRGVRTAHDLFAALAHRLRRTPAAALRTRRVRVPGPHKAVIVARAVLGDRALAGRP